MESLALSALTLATGPAGAVVVLLVILVGVWHVANKNVFPLIKGFIEQNQKNLENIMTEHSKDRMAFEKAITSLTKRQDKFEDDIIDIKADIRIIKDRP